MNIKEIAYLMTQYCNYGVASIDEYRKYYIDEELELDEDNISDYNEYLMNNGYEPYWNDLDEMLMGYSGVEIARMCFYGKFNFSYEYHQFNGYANIDSFEGCDIVREMKRDRRFIDWYIEQNDLINEDDEDVQECIKECNRLLKLGY